jgi:hypothetical protein
MEGLDLAFVIAAAAALSSWILPWEVRGYCPHIPGGFGSKIFNFLSSLL